MKARRAGRGGEVSARTGPMTLGNAAAAGMRLIMWCLDCGRQVEPDPARMVTHFGAEFSRPRLARKVGDLQKPRNFSGFVI